MNGENNGMSIPVTRRELREELDLLQQKIDSEINGKMERQERRLEHRMDLWGGALMERISDSEKRLLDEIARHTRAVLESMATQISVVDEKYKDLPRRTAQLEVDVQALKRR